MRGTFERLGIRRNCNVFRAAGVLMAGLATVAVSFTITGCAQEAPPQAVVPAAPGEYYVPHQAVPKPLPDSALSPGNVAVGGPYQDQPLTYQRLPEEAEFIAAYNKVHQPRIAVYVNRTLQGQVIPANSGGPMQTTEHTETSTGAVTAGHEDYSSYEDAYGRIVSNSNSNFQSTGPAQYSELTTTYLAPGAYDEADARTLDYQALESILCDWLSAGGQVHLISPDYLAEHLTTADVAALSQGKPVAMDNLAEKVGADVLIQVQAHPTRQAGGELQVRLVAQAMNIQGGEAIGTAVVDVPLPLDKVQLNDYTRYMARKLETDMIAAWETYAANPAPPRPAQSASPLPPVQDQRPPAAPRSGLPPVPPPSGSIAPASQPVEEMQVLPQ